MSLNKVTGLDESVTAILVQQSFQWEKENVFDVEHPESVCTPEQFRDAITAIKQNAFLMGAAFGYKLKEDHFNS